MRWLLSISLILALSNTGCTPQPKAHFVELDGMPEAKICYEIKYDVEPKVELTCFGEWIGVFQIDSVLLENIASIIVNLDGRRLRLRSMIEINRKNNAK